jgi:hypothetical protein
VAENDALPKDIDALLPMDPGEKPFILEDFKNLVTSYGISIEVK